MTGIIDAHPFTEGAEPHEGSIDSTTPTHPGQTPAGQTHAGQTHAGPADAGALIEQAKGVLIFRYGIAADAAYSLLELWSAQTDASLDQVAHAVVHEICQGDRTTPSDPGLVRWLEGRLRREFPGAECEGT